MTDIPWITIAGAVGITGLVASLTLFVTSLSLYLYGLARRRKRG